MENQTDNKFTWVIKNFSSLQYDRIYSDPLVIDGCNWYLFAYPKGKKPNVFSLYLQVADSGTSPFGWRRHTKYSLTVVNQLSEKLSQVKGERLWWFDQKSPAVGFSAFIPLTKLHAKNGGFLVNDELKIVVEVKVLEVIGKLDVPNETQAATKPLKKIKLEETSSAKQSIDVNGFHVLPSQVDFMKRIFERYPDVALEFRLKNPILKTAYINVLLTLIETLRQSPRGISKDDMADAYDSLKSLKDAGFKLNWLKKKLSEVPEKKEKEEACEARMKEIEQELNDLKEKVLAASRAPLTFDDVFS